MGQIAEIRKAQENGSKYGHSVRRQVKNGKRSSELKKKKKHFYKSLDQLTNTAEKAKSEPLGANDILSKKSYKEINLSDLKDEAKESKPVNDLLAEARPTIKVKNAQTAYLKRKRVKERRKKVEETKKKLELENIEKNIILGNKEKETTQAIIQENNKKVGNEGEWEENGKSGLVKSKKEKKEKSEKNKKRKKKSKKLKTEVKVAEENIKITENKNKENKKVEKKENESDNNKVVEIKEKKVMKKEKRKKNKELKSQKKVKKNILEETKKTKNIKKRNKMEKIKNNNEEANRRETLIENQVEKNEPDFPNYDLTKTGTPDLNCTEYSEDMNSEPPDSDDANGSGPESFLDSLEKKIDEMISVKTSLRNAYQLEPGEVAFKREPDLIENEIKKEVLDESQVTDVLDENQVEQVLKESEKKEYLICFRNLLKGLEKQKIKELTYTVLEPQEILDLFLVNERKKRFGFLKVSSKEALEKVLKLDGWAVDGRYIRVKEANLIDLKKDPPKLGNLNLTPPPVPKKRKKKEDFDSAVIEKQINDLSEVKKNAKVDDNEKKLCQRYSLFLGNMNYSTTDEQIRIFLESIVAPTKILRVRRPNKRTIAFVDLADKESLERVLKLGGSKLMGRSIRVELCGESSKKRTDRSDFAQNTEVGGEDSNPIFRKRSRDFSKKPKAKKLKKN